MTVEVRVSFTDATATCPEFGLTWDQVNGIQERAVKRGLERVAAVSRTRIGVDETSFQKQHEYVNIVTDLCGGHVLHVAGGRGKEPWTASSSR